MANRHWVIGLGLFLTGIYLSLPTKIKTNCSFECYNNGTVVTRDDFCECACPAQFTGLLCETELLPSKWPDGPYALLMPTSGCPESTRHGWGAGFIHFTTKHEMEIKRQQSNDDFQKMSFTEQTSELAGNFKPYSFELKFCFKHPNTSVNNAALLQDLNVTVFGIKEGCPRGFVEEVHKLSLPALQSWWTDGYLPYFDIRNESNDMVLVTKHCHGNESEDIPTVEYDRPFISVKEYGIDCPTFMDEYDVLEETLQFHTPSQHSIEQRHPTTLSFCVFKPTTKADLHPSSWPNGPYAVLMLNTGCPEPLSHGWEVGYITLKAPPSDKRENDQDGCGKVMMLGQMMETFHPNCFQMFFCFKKRQQDYKNEIQWPIGTYAIFSAGNGCLKGFAGQLVQTTKQGVQSWTPTGLLPILKVDCSGGECVIDLYICQKIGKDTELSSDWKKPFALPQPYSTSFYLECERGPIAADGFRVVSSWLYDFVVCLYIPIETTINDCNEYEFKCGSGECVKKIHVCDHIKDCHDGSDELFDNCDQRCSGGSFYCAENDKCISKNRLCDGVVDCQEHEEDEHGNICPSKCPPGSLYMGLQFRSNTKMSACMVETDEDVNSEKTCGFEIFCKARDICARVKQLCDELKPIQGQGQDQAHRDDEPYKMENRKYCQGTLGLMDGSIGDWQLSASSYRDEHKPDMSRPSKNSWCPMTNEENPYLEVALDSVSIIGGVIVYNDAEIRGSVMANFYTPKIVPIGCGSFSVKYAIVQNRFQPYPNKFFEIDTSSKIDKPQKFIFLRPVLARYVRIYPLQNILEGPLCLRLDLLGCTQSGFDHERISLGRLEETSLHVPIGHLHSLTSEFRLPDKIYRWNMTVPDGRYIELSFLNITLYNQSGMQTDRRCPHDMITFNDLFEPITAQHNNLTPTYPTDKATLVMSFISCEKELQGTFGFSVHLRAKAIPTIWMQVKDSNINEGKLITYSLLGLFVNLPKKQTWSLRSDVYGRPLLLSFKTFNVPCNSDNELTIDSKIYTEHDLCNTGRRPRKVYKEWAIHIGFVYSERVSRYNPEGFSAMFRIEPVSKYHKWFKTNETHEPTDHIEQHGRGKAPETPDHIGPFGVNTAFKPPDTIGQFGVYTANEPQDNIGQLGVDKAPETPIGPFGVNTVNKPPEHIGHLGKYTANGPPDNIGQLGIGTANGPPHDIGQLEMGTANGPPHNIGQLGMGTADGPPHDIGQLGMGTDNMPLHDIGQLGMGKANGPPDDIEQLGMDTVHGPPDQIGQLGMDTVHGPPDQIGQLGMDTVHGPPDQIGQLGMDTVNEPPDRMGQLGIGSVFGPPDHMGQLGFGTVHRPPDHTGQLGVYTVYSSTVKKHYRFGYQIGFENWITQAKYCQRFNYSLVVIHGREEMEFLQAWLFYRISQLFSTSMARSSAFPKSREWSPYQRYYTHIGLIRYRGIDGLKEIWQDGTSPSFTAWDMGEPKEVNINRCTAMAVNMTTGKVHWHTRLCNETTQSDDDRLVSLCEKSIGGTLNIDNQTTSLLRPADRGPKGGLNTEVLLYYTVSGKNQDNQANTTPLQTHSLGRCNSTEWLSDLAICDGFPDCQDGSDEIGCHSHSIEYCSDTMFQCKSGECIHIGQVCDYILDCKDESDEYCSTLVCNADEFRCENKQCIPNYLRCNAVEDCIDGSDEKYCTTCNETTAFSCGDLTCIDLTLKCDSIPNCGTGRDEADCERVYKTCLDYWNAGYEENVVIDNPDHYVECHYHVDGEELSIDSYVDRKVLRRNFLKNKQEMRIMMDDFSGFGKCYLEIYLLCPYGNADCKPAKIPIEISNGITRTEAPAVQEVFFYYLTHTSIHITLQNDRTVKMGTANCSMTVSVPYFRCGDGKKITSSRKCLYDINRAGVIDGCRNLNHFDNCGSFICPVGYFKCPSSFCLAQRHLCDGERQCPGGEDETDCWCEGRHTITVLIYNEEVDKGILPIVQKFARQLYSTQVAVYTYRYTLDTTHNTFVVRKTPVHPYNEALYLDEVESFTAHIHLLYDEICDTFNASGINVINIEQYEWYSYKGEFANSTRIDHVYKVSEDPNLEHKVKTTTTENESTIVLNSWNVLSANGIALFPTLCPENMASDCKDQFRCASSKVCLPVNHVCDGIPHCPFEDDETMCDFKCHPKCKCDLYVAECQSVNFRNEDLSEVASTVRILDISENNMNGTLVIPKRFHYLVKLFAKNCGIRSVANNTFSNANNIIHLDLSFNKIKTITKNMFYGLNRLEVLQLNGNYYLETIQPRSFQMMSSLSSLAIVKTKIREILPETFVGLTVETLNISCNAITKMHQRSFKNMSAEIIDFSGNDIETFDKDIFSGIKPDKLAKIISPAYKFCCVKPQSLPDDNCYPKQDEFSSCEDLMRNPILQTLVWVLGFAAVIANGCTVFYRVYHDRNSLKTGFGMFVTNLAVSDSLMGFYMLIIAFADITFRNRYMMMDDYWRNSVWCDLAGVLATVSSEASVLFMFLITMDRILVIKYPFGQWKFTVQSSNIATIVSWTVSWILALVPIVIKDYFERRFYSISGVCLAHPLTHRRPPGWLYSFLIYVALNFVAFILIAIGQLIIYLEIKKTSKRMKKVRSKRLNDVKIAKKLLFVLATDFMCWFPIGVMAIMAASGYVIPGEVYAWTAVLIVPVNAALNPFLYTLSTVMREKVSSTTINTSALKDDKSFKDKNVQCTIGVGPTTIYGTPKVLVNTPLDDVPPEQVSMEPKDVLKAYIAIARNMTGLHGRNHVNGNFKIRDVLYSTKGRKIQVCLQLPVRAGSIGDKEKDMKDAGHVLRYMLKFTKSLK